MKPETVEERIRAAMTGEQIASRDDLWEVIAARRAAGERIVLPAQRKRLTRVLAIGAIAAAALTVLVPLQRDEPIAAPPRHETKASMEESIFLPGALLAQSSTEPAYGPLSKLVRTDLRPGRWVLGQVVNGEVHEQYAYSLTRSRYENQPSWLVVSDYYYGSVIRKTDSLWTSTDSLAPRYRTAYSGTVRTEQTYRAEDILTGTTHNGFTSWSVTPRDARSWDVINGVLQVSTVALRFQATPLSRGWKRSLPYPALTSKNTVVYLNWVVDGEEEIEVPAGKFSAWRIRLQFGDKPLKPYDAANPPAGVYYWVSKDRQWMLRMLFLGEGGPQTPPVVLLEGSEE